MHGENHKRVARDVAQDSLDDTDGGDIREFVGENEGGYKARDAEERTGDKNGERFPEDVVHDAEIRVGNFEIRVGRECDDGGYDESQDVFASRVIPA